MAIPASLNKQEAYFIYFYGQLVVCSVVLNLKKLKKTRKEVNLSGLWDSFKTIVPSLFW